MMAIYNSSSLAMALALFSWSNEWVLTDAHMGLWPLAGIALVLGYYVVVYRLILAAPTAGAIVPRYQAPDKLSPATIRFFEHRTFDEKAFAANVLDLAARGYTEIRGGQGEPYSLVRTGADESQLPDDEKALARLLFQDGSALRIDLRHTSEIEHIKKTMARSVESVAAAYFHSNTRYVAGGVALTLVALLALIATTPFAGTLLFGCAGLVFFGGIMAFAGTSVVRDVRRSLQRKSTLGMVMAVTGSVAMVPVLVLACACGLIIVLMAHGTSLLFAAFLLAAVLLNVAAFHRRQVPTQRGQQLADEAAGFRQFLATVEADPLNRVSDGVTAPEMIGKMLPYAMAFDLEHRWASQHFAHAFGFAGGEYVGSNRREAGDVLPQGMKFPNPFDLLSLANFLQEADPRTNRAPTQKQNAAGGPDL
jgi:Ca2+/Na+ antiporter